MFIPPPPRAGGGREDMAGLNPGTLPFKCLFCDGEPLGVMRTKEEANIPHPASVIIRGVGTVGK